MAEYMEKLMKKTAAKLRIGQIDKVKPQVEKNQDDENGDEIPPEDPNA